MSAFSKQSARFETDREALDQELGAAGLPEEAPTVGQYINGFQLKSGKVAQDGCVGVG